jgi:DNA (cytosine-5)-methyltransferase 1
MKVLSLFSGVGGFDAGLEAAGMQTVFQCEWNKHALNILNRHWANVPKWEDVSTLTGKHILSQAPEVDVVAWGSPCQDLSVVGKRAGLDGQRSGLFHEGIRIIKELRKESNNEYPKISIWENVAGALSSNGGADFGVILNEMAEAGALVIEWAVLDAQYFGVPQVRRRIFVIAIFDSSIARNCPDPLLPVAESVRRNGTQDGYITFYTSQGRQDKYRKSIVSALKTAGTSCITGSEIPPRKFTPLECERLMGWQDDHTRWNADGTEQADTHRYKQCGNGVASPVAKWIGQKLMDIER